MKKKILVGSIIVLTVFLGFFRDHIFVSLNKVIESGNDTEGELSHLKWVLTALFSLLYLIDACILLFVLFENKKYIWLAIFSYALLFLIAITSVVLGSFFSSFDEVYPFVRTIMGVAQSPIVMMVLAAAGYLKSEPASGGNSAVS